jgi:transposase
MGSIEAIHGITSCRTMDKGYDFADIRKLVEEYGYIVYIKNHGEESIRRDILGFRARRWVVERTHSWLNRFRRLLIRWEKKMKITLLCYI